MACLWFWTSAAGALAANDDHAYRSALESFNRGDDARALAQLGQTPADAAPGARADVLNLRGAIYLRQHRYDQAQAEFARASALDPHLWAARFNEAEVSFRQGRYAESRRQFGALLGQTSRIFHSEQHHFVEYKLLLAGICAGEDKPARDFVAAHRDDERPPLAWYYLNAALERQHGHAQKAGQWLAQSDARNGAGSGRTYAESFDRLGWGNSVSAPGGAATELARATAPRSRTLPSAPQDEATVAVVEVLPDAPKVAFRDSSVEFGPHGNGRPGASGLVPTPPANASDALPSAEDLPPGADDPAAVFAEILRTGRDAGPGTLAKPKRTRATPSPSPGASPDASPVTANQGGTPAPKPGPAASPTPEFTEKYEAAYVKFLEKNYPETLSLLDEADKIQLNQSQSVSLRFKSHYALAYLAYRKQDYPAALTELDQADQTQKNADSFNLRGLIFSKQHNYDQAEAMFHRAIVTDPALWAAKFNYAELPFNRGNYTDARTRFEELFSQTDDKKQPREAELTQYKVFLTLLLEGKVEAASTFMDHLNFSGATPARYFCNAALNFRAGSVDKAKNWIDDAKKEYPPQLVAIFIESFYRLGWMADPNAPPGTMVAQATPAGTPAVTTSGTQPTTVATATATPSAVPTATPIIVAAASPTPTPLAVPSASVRPSPAVVAVATPTATTRPTGTPAPAIAAATPTPTAPAIAAATPAASPAQTFAWASATPSRPFDTLTSLPATPSASTAPLVVHATPALTPAATAPPVIAAATATATPARSVALASASPSARPTTAPVVVVAPTPARTVASAAVSPTPAGTLAVARATPTPTVGPEATETVAAIDAPEKKKRRRRIVVLVLVLGQAIYYVSKMSSVLSGRKRREELAASRRRETADSSK